MKTKQTLMRALVAITALAAAGSTFADTIYNNFNGYIDFWNPFGNPNTATYGETFTAPSNGDVNLQDFGFYMGSPEVAGDILLRAYIATWTGTQAGTLLYTSADFDYANTGDAHLTFSTGGLPLTPGASYVAFLSVSELYGQSSGEAFVSQGDPTIPGGNFVYYNNGGDFAALFNSTWDATGLKPDWAFNATFTSGGGGLTLVSAASSKKQGNAGTFDIDLPLDGTGVECRQGALGTQTVIKMTFSGTVDSVDSTSTSCGNVISTTIDGSTVSVALRNIQTNCDGSDVTVTLTGVHGGSGDLDTAAVTFGQLAGDVTGDGVVDGNDLHSVRMNSGRGLVTDANFRNDVSSDGKVNHADISLTKKALGNSLP